MIHTGGGSYLSIINRDGIDPSEILTCMCDQLTSYLPSHPPTYIHHSSRSLIPLSIHVQYTLPRTERNRPRGVLASWSSLKKKKSFSGKINTSCGFPQVKYLVFLCICERNFNYCQAQVLIWYSSSKPPCDKVFSSNEVLLACCLAINVAGCIRSYTKWLVVYVCILYISVQA